MRNFLFTSESVTEGHPDKMCDQISDAVLDRMLQSDPMAHVACECSVTTGMVLVMGEIKADPDKSASAFADIPSVVRNTINEIGYSNKCDFNGNTCAVLTSIDPQSSCIDQGVNKEGAGDQGMMFGFACDDTPELMPAPISMAHKLVKRLTAVRRENIIPYLNPDGKSQVTFEYVDDKPVRIKKILISAHHEAGVEYDRIRNDIINNVINPVVPPELMEGMTDKNIHVNPTGSFVIGGPVADSGLTGRKIIVDTYGGFSRHGGGAFSGKDPTKVDRSAAYAARYLAKNVVAAGLARKCELQIAYAIGEAEPHSIMIDTFGTGVISEAAIEKLLLANFDPRPAEIIKRFDLRRPIYRQLASYGHMGREDLDLKDVPWEATDLADILKKC